MQAILAVFRSRAQAIDCVSRFKHFGIPASVVSTPKEANVGCGLSTKIGVFDLGRARQALSGANYGAFVGFFRVETKYGKTFVSPA